MAIKMIAPVKRITQTEERKQIIKEDLKLSLPTEESSVSQDMSELIWLFYGQKKIGKTSLAAKFPNAILIGFEAASRSVNCKKVFCPTWEHFLQYIKLLKIQKHEFKTAIIDTGLQAYNRCLEYICNIQNIEYPKDNDFGKDWKKISTEFFRVHTELQGLGMGLVIVCHEKLKESETRSGQKFDMVMPDLSAGAEKCYKAIVDNMIYYHKAGNRRFLQLQGTDYIDAGAVFGDEEYDVKFFRTKKGEKIHAVDAGNSAGEAFNNLENAFFCKADESYTEESKKWEVEQITKSVRNKINKRR
jgi:hypothetical protein